MKEAWKDKIDRVRKRGVTRLNSRGGPLSWNKSSYKCCADLWKTAGYIWTHNRLHICTIAASYIIMMRNIYYFKHWGNNTGARGYILNHQSLMFHINICAKLNKLGGFYLLWTHCPFGLSCRMCQLYFIGYLELFMYGGILFLSTARCCFSTAFNPMPCIYPALRSQCSKEGQRPTSDTSYFKYSITQCAFFFLKRRAEHRGGLIHI